MSTVRFVQFRWLERKGTRYDSYKY